MPTTRHSSDTPLTIVGGSLAGLSLALACATRGLRVSVVERSTREIRGGDSLSVDLGLLASVTGHDPRVLPLLPVVPAYRHLATWKALHAWLRTRATETSGIVMESGKTVTSIQALSDHVKLIFADGSERTTSGVIGADGYNSTVRRAISPEDPSARYAGYLVWRGLVDESLLDRPVSWPSDAGLWIEFSKGYRLVAATLPGKDGSLEMGRRQITFAWFDTHHDDLLARTGCLTPEGLIVGTLSPERISQDVRTDLIDLAPRVWPSLWVDAVIAGIRAHDTLSGAPISEYLPERLACGRIAMIGDAAHVVSPMTGRGFLTGLEDASTLARALAYRSADEPVDAAFSHYEATRLPFVKGLVAHSRRLSTDYVRYATVNS